MQSVTYPLQEVMGSNQGHIISNLLKDTKHTSLVVFFTLSYNLSTLHQDTVEQMRVFDDNLGIIFVIMLWVLIRVASEVFVISP